MSRATVRAAVAAFFAPPAVAGLKTLYPASPGTIPGDAYYDGQVGAGAAMFVFISRNREWRRGIGGPHSGVKEILYDVGLVGEFRANGIDPVVAQAAHDDFVEALLERGRSDRTLGEPSIFQAGEGDTLGAADLDVESDLPYTKGNSIRIWTVLRSSVVEMIQS